MDSRVSALTDQLLLIERELRVLGWWSVEAPSAEALASQQPFCVDTLDFEAWLQWIFLPRMKQLLESAGPLPSVSGIREMAEMSWPGREAQARALLIALGEFDRLIGSAH
ncbi:MULTISPECIES: YqcC family protein [unclassified Pseudomonas]|uniref:YqcC family protein n=1 Tax=unclassified Pseudomonas TaxID=196821 RepID=UPI002448D739|nr:MULTISPECIES: YqcC family protein [unclassified Pseudomonas]MDG9923718.1 YqcC family protein [Pseudomonas sp. GD04045]MDH0036007.1 YqcC family protein [Pseudomonas sp. GD04019]